MDDCDDDEDITRDSTKAARHAFNAGYRDGIDEAKEKNQQAGFDSGYSNGLQIGMATGFFKGLLNEISNDSNNIFSEDCKKLVQSSRLDTLLNDMSKTSCCICNDSKLSDVSYKEIEDIQRDNNRNCISKLMEKYSLAISEIEIDDSEMDKIKITKATPTILSV
ncbi:uncharacterized protein LOC143911108 isoform X2 [Arctopsyche grandis]|uniref:uncharacterized protein LOC143911108 isoform X2 n=1 Tax=Arctopsyche grandis TaxID=121162 RepID=UPI00406D86F9